jgi:hypothetical protein
MRFPTSAFTIPRPHFLTPPPNAALVEDILRSTSSSSMEKLGQYQALLRGKTRSLGGGLGFFDHGIIAGLVVVSAPLFLGIAASCYYAPYILTAIF